MSDIQKEKEALITPLFCEPDNDTIGDRHDSIIDISDCSTKEISMNQGFIKIPRSLLQDPRFDTLSAKQIRVLLKLIELACYREQTVSVAEHLIILKPGQLLYSLRYIVEACKCSGRGPKDNVSKNDVERLLNFLELIGKLRQELRHKRLLITLTFLDDCELEKNETETQTETKLRQQRDKTETNTKKEKKDKKEKDNTRASRAEPSADALELARFLFSSIQKWKPNFKKPNEKRWGIEFDKCLKHYSKDRILSVLAWLPENDFWRGNVMCPSKLLKQMERLEVDKEKSVQDLSVKKNIEFVIECKKANPDLLKRLIIKSTYVINESTSKDLSFKMQHEAFKEAFLHIAGGKRYVQN
jgi:hypothetical protein